MDHLLVHPNKKGFLKIQEIQTDLLGWSWNQSCPKGEEINPKSIRKFHFNHIVIVQLKQLHERPTKPFFLNSIFNLVFFCKLIAQNINALQALPWDGKSRELNCG